MLLGACATAPTSSFMPLGAQASAPQAFVEFCKRQPEQCGVEAQAAPAVIAAAQTRANRQVWRAAFGTATTEEAGRVQERWDRPTAAIAPAPRLATAEVSAAVDWARLFAEARGDGAAAAKADKPAIAITTPAPSRIAEFTPKLWSTISKVNARVNRTIDNRSDILAYGVEDFWTMPSLSGQSFGDCEDFVLEKRASLIAGGVPAEALSIAVVDAASGQAHAVLVVTTSKGDYVLDNLTPWILPWDKTNYHWQARQVSGVDAFSWASVGSRATWMRRAL